MKKTGQKDWKINGPKYRDIHGTRFVEATCAHGVGHHNGTHGCDGCCVDMPKEISDQLSTD